jgi:hypothetical protein
MGIANTLCFHDPDLQFRHQNSPISWSEAAAP